MSINAKFILSLGSGIMLLVAAGASNAAAEPCHPLSSIQQRIVAKADEGMPQLQSFAWMTSRIYGIDMFQISESIDQWRAAAACSAEAAAKIRDNAEDLATAGRSAD